jgi:hypothetical protein
MSSVLCLPSSQYCVYLRLSTVFTFVSVLCLPLSRQHTVIQLPTASARYLPPSFSPLLAPCQQGRCQRGATREQRGMVLPLVGASRSLGRSTDSPPPHNTLVAQPVTHPPLVLLLPGLSHYSVNVWRTAFRQGW